jgi:hypothetical protein
MDTVCPSVPQTVDLASRVDAPRSTLGTPDCHAIGLFANASFDEADEIVPRAHFGRTYCLGSMRAFGHSSGTLFAVR